MNISVFARYKVKCRCKLCYNTPSFDCPNDWHTVINRWQKTMEGGKFMKLIARHLNESLLIEVDFQDNKIYFGEFNPNTGETCDYYYTFEMVDLKKNLSS